MKPIEQARLELNRAIKDDPGWGKFEIALKAGLKLKKVMVDKKLSTAKANCPACKAPGALHGRLITGQAAGRHRRSGGAFRMWCDTPGCAQMME